MSRDLRPLSASVERPRGEAPFVTLAILSADLKAKPVHTVRVDPMDALKLADELLRAARIVLGGVRQ